MGGEWRTTAKDRRSEKLLIENIMRKKLRKEKTKKKTTVTMMKLIPGDRYTNKRTKRSI